ncbi:hypothetical protein [Saccharothrix sp. NRRL B-16348]|uniref:hypothetical protein n=1 Tax=Saccharothrix sp. NRRL B-16348 TaxID=1415542 RepID=UPI0006B056BF|nr:hypothetical protein [Saccharothrix sp. NRRL B-16348]
MTDAEAVNDMSTKERILAQTALLLESRGDTEAVQLLADVQDISFEYTGESYYYESWRVETRAAVLEVEDHMVARFTDEIRQRIATTLEYVAGRHGEHGVDEVRAEPALPQVGPDWRALVKGRSESDRSSNHARRERNAPQHPTEDGLTFSSREELAVYHVLKTLQQEAQEDNTIAIMPLPAARLRAGHTWSPDCVVIGNGRALIFEIDGPHHRAGRRYVDDRNRDLQWSRCRVQVVRIAVEDVRDANKLKVRLKEEILRHLWRR